MTGELHNIRHTLVPPNDHSQKLYPNARGYLDNTNVGIPTEIRQHVAKMAQLGTRGHHIPLVKWRRPLFDIWGVIGFFSCVLSALWAIAALFGAYMVFR